MERRLERPNPWLVAPSGIRLMNRSMADASRCGSSRPAIATQTASDRFDDVRREPHRSVDQFERLPIGVLRSDVIELQVVEPDGVAVPLRQRQADELFGRFERLALVRVPQRLLNGRSSRHVLEQHRQRE